MSQLYPNESVIPELGTFVSRLLSKYGRPIGYDRNRTVWKMRGTHVIKLPKNEDGVSDNDWEGSVSDPGYTAKTRLLHIDGIPVVVMEYVEGASLSQIAAYQNLPPTNLGWASAFDDAQVGFNRFGKLLAYD